MLNKDNITGLQMQMEATLTVKLKSPEFNQLQSAFYSSESAPFLSNYDYSDNFAVTGMQIYTSDQGDFGIFSLRMIKGYTKR